VKKKILIVLAVVVVVLGAFVGYIASQVTNVTPIVDGAKLPNGTVVIQDSYVAVYAVPVGNNHVVFIDCSNDPDATAMRAAIEKNKWIVDAVLVTHGHLDHINGCQAMREIPIVAHEAETAYIYGDEKPKGPLVKFFPAHKAHLNVQRTVKDNDVVTFGEKSFRVFHVPGHTPGSVAYLVDGVLFTGDVAAFKHDGTLTGSSPVPHGFSPMTKRRIARACAHSRRESAKSTSSRPRIPR
jgi:glyoxylase-like metal-dependent hydrolase (beta-lactamase superfamily II)